MGFKKWLGGDLRVVLCQHAHVRQDMSGLSRQKFKCEFSFG